MATTYGTIPTSSAPGAGASGSSTTLDYISRAKDRGQSALATCRPWRELAHLGAFSLPPSLGEAYLRIRKNAAYFSMNYAIVVLLVVFVSLLWHPVSLMVFLATMCLWLFFYFLRDSDAPLVLFGRVVGDAVVLGALSVVTLALLLFTGATLNILVSLLVGILVIVAHAAIRRTDDHDEEEGAGPIGGGWYQAVDVSS